MGIVKATFKNIAGTPQRRGSVTYRVPRQRTAANGEHIVTVVEHIVPISSIGTADSPSLEQGVADVVIRIGTHQSEYKINVPEADEDLQKLIDEYEPHDPPIVSLVKDYRDEMISTREAVETSLQHYGGVLTGLAERAERAAKDAEDKAPLDSPTFTGPVTMSELTIPTSAENGMVWTSDAEGVGSWKPVAGGTSGVIVKGNPEATPPVASSSGRGDVAIGAGAMTSSANGSGVAIGEGARTFFQGNVAIGWNASSQGVAIGTGAKSNHGGSTALGANASTTKSGQVMLGRSTETVTMPGKAEIGEGTAMVTLSTRITSGKAELVAQFATGSPVVIATQL